jgi:hypothetical protein
VAGSNAQGVEQERCAGRQALSVVAAALVALGFAACDEAAHVGDDNATRASRPAARKEPLGDTGKMLRRQDHDGDFGSADGDVPHSLFDADDGEVRYFGHRADRPDRRAIASLVARYYAAAASHDGAAVCAIVDRSLAGSFMPARAEAYRAGGQPARDGCAPAMTEMLAHLLGRSPADLVATKVIGVRVRGDEGVALLRLRNSDVRYMPFVREAGVWKLESVFDIGLA